MKYYELDKSEQNLLDAVERNELIKVPNVAKAKKEVVQAVKQNSNKTRNINIRLPELTVHRLKVKAAREGVPYQTLAASILHKNS